MLGAQAAEFGLVPDPYTGNWSGTLVTPEKTQPLHATIIAYKDSIKVTFGPNQTSGPKLNRRSLMGTMTAALEP